MRLPCPLAVAVCATLTMQAASAQVADNRRVAAPTQDAPPVAIETTDHVGFGEITLHAPGPVGFIVNRHGDVVTVKLGHPFAIAAALRNPANVSDIIVGTQQVDIALVPGTQLRLSHAPASITIDALNAPRISRAETGPHPRPLPAKPSVPPPVADALVAGADAAPSAAANPVAAQTGAPEPSPPDPERAAAITAVLSPRAHLIEPVLDSADPAIFVPMTSQAGAALFRRDGEMMLVFDVPVTFSTAEVQSDPVFGHLTAERTSDASVIHIPLPAPASLHLTHSREGWEVTAIPTAEAVMGIEPRLVEDAADKVRMRLEAAQASRVVTVIDPRTGARMLVGTQRDVGQGLAIERNMVQFSLLSTVQGVVVTATSDDIGMRETRDGFVLFGGAQSGGTILSSNMMPVAATESRPDLSRLFNMPDATVATISQTLRDRIMFSSSTPILGRAQPRMSVAEAMLALGMGVEAEAVLRVAVADDPRLNEAPRTIALRAIAGILAGRPADAAAIEDPRLNGNDEVALWRAVYGAGLDETCVLCARSFDAMLPLLRTYPQPLRERLLPLALETMALGGQAAAAQQALKAMPNDTSLDLARGMADEMTGQTDSALKQYARVVQRSDRLSRYRALTRSVGVHLARHDIDPRQAADALDKLLYGWRGDQRELALRIRMADLRRQVGQWREAIALLRDAQAAFPDDRQRIEGEITGSLSALLDGNATVQMAPADFVAMYDENADLLKTGPWAERGLSKLADNLIALDLPARADPILARMLTDANDPAKKAIIGARLASVRLSESAPDAAIAALSSSAAPDLAPDLNETRQLLLARAEVARGEADKATALLQQLNTRAANDLRATILI